MCGVAMGSIKDPYGGPTDVASKNAAAGKIVVANLFGKSGGAGSVSVCTFAGGCKTNLIDANMYFVYGIAMSRDGDCWADATNKSGTAVALTYFKNCNGSGQTATGFSNPSYGGLACTLVGGPFALEGRTMFGHLNKASTRFVGADSEGNQVDVYTYSPTKLQYEYSFTNGIFGSGEPSDAAYSPG
ncbi:MAG: hypothetical protein WB609_08555 [Candidatus Cybelea sp.]